MDVEIFGFGKDGEGVGELDGKRVFVHGALAGEVVHVRLTEEKKTYAKGEAVKVKVASKDREEPICPVFGECGGCQVMHLKYEAQLKMKRQKVLDALQRIGKIEVEVEACLRSPKELYYRNKIQLPVTKDGRAGLYRRGSHEIIPVDQCYIHSELGERVFKKLQRRLTGELRHVLIKSAVNTGEALVVFITRDAPSKALKALAKELVGDEVKGVCLSINRREGNRVLGGSFSVLAGAGVIEEKLLGLKFKVSPASFFQVNPWQAEKLYAKVVELANLSGEEVVLDAFCGVGTLSLLLAQQAKRVLGIECVEEAVIDARENAKVNGIENVEFECARVEEAELNQVDIAVLNPPRKGCERSVLEAMCAKTLIYVSCDPATLARDLRILIDLGYEVEVVIPFDMFPQTAHVETVVRCRKKTLTR
ncbi:MAG: 23S rRNA (uracil-C(5))-methyltransferase RlmCD [Chlamydiia bacterium]|nr:23S rRNA (uracil-C(5))-methyltransferase RlmCD [Chlamydiia bacterium]MCH9616065.1 23S rRNA (uracil-C(5))-methyltransferase RlmCD [Chlamydiia bacterium]MCH9629088.1 23S rRNA (uracil-C(5))-methyltransferase RlmCD [Chlamydiia bacterium]